jgi:hypothetical protein
MANTESASSPTKRSTTVKEKSTSSNKKTIGGVTMTTEQLCVLSTFMCEAARMIGVRDASPSISHCRNSYKLVQDIVKELMGE